MSSQHPLVHPSSGGLSTRRSARKGTEEHNRCGWVRIPCFEHRNRGRGIDRRARSRGAGGRSLRPSVLRGRESRAGLRARVLGVLRVEAAASGACGDSRLCVAAGWKSVEQRRTTTKQRCGGGGCRRTLATGRGQPLRYDDVSGGSSSPRRPTKWGYMHSKRRAGRSSVARPSPTGWSWGSTWSVRAQGVNTSPGEAHAASTERRLPGRRFPCVDMVRRRGQPPAAGGVGERIADQARFLAGRFGPFVRSSPSLLPRLAGQ